MWNCLLLLLFLGLIIISVVTAEQGSSAHPYGVKVFTLGEAKLREPCRALSVEEIVSDPIVSSAVRDAHLALSKFRSKMGFGRAIAAPQVGHSLRFVALNLDGHPTTMFNPEITQRSRETFTMWDDCLSFPDRMCCVRRHKSVSVVFQDEKGTVCEWKDCPQDLSELLQHEIDHLEGVLAVDRAIRPDKSPISESTSSVVCRDEWLRRRDHFNRMVDFSY